MQQPRATTIMPTTTNCPRLSSRAAFWLGRSRTLPPSTPGPCDTAPLPPDIIRCFVTEVAWRPVRLVIDSSALDIALRAPQIPHKAPTPYSPTEWSFVSDSE